MRIDGNLIIEEAYQAKFSKDASGYTILSVISGTVEMKGNKVIVLAD